NNDHDSVQLTLKKGMNLSLSMEVMFKLSLGLYSLLFIIIFALRLKQLKEDIQIIIQYWIRILNIKLVWVKEFDKFIANYVSTIFMFDIFRSSSKLLKTFIYHKKNVSSFDYSEFDNSQFICSGSIDKTVCVWDFDNNKQIQSFNGHSDSVNCVKFSPYHYHNHRQNVICSSSSDTTIRFWDFKHNQQLQIFNGQIWGVGGIEFSPFNSDTKQFVYGMLKHPIHYIFSMDMKSYVWCVDISPLQNNNNNDKSNNIGVIGGNGYTICSGSGDKTVRIWDIETTKQLSLFKGCYGAVNSVKYGSNELLNTILSGSSDKSVRLWDIRSGQQIQVFNGHIYRVTCVEYSPFVIKNNIGNSNVICSGSSDNTIRFWDIRSNKNELYVMKLDEQFVFGDERIEFVLIYSHEVKIKLIYFYFSYAIFENMKYLDCN
ncbi:WD-40 repeat protein, partial [Reticulomyxa filosa]